MSSSDLSTDLDEQDPRIEHLFEQLMALSAGDLTARGVPSEQGDTVDAIIMGFNMLAEEMSGQISRLQDAEQKLAEHAQALERSNAKLQEFVYVTSHDLQEPLRMISAYTQLLKEDYADQLDADAHEYIRYASEGAIRLQRLIRALLAYSRTNAQEIETESLALSDVVEEARINLHVAIEESGATIEVGTLPRVQGDHTLLVQLLQNLMGNAIKFRGDRPPHIEVFASQDNGQVEVTVRDNGIGIQPEFLEKIFVVFQRLHRADTYEGTGIGLSICRTIVERHGGKISATSTPGQGSAFMFTLPPDGAPP